MSKNNVADIKQLKSWGTLDTKCYKELMASLGKSKKILILSPKNSGKSTVQAALTQHFHSEQKEVLVVPGITGVSLNNFKSNKKVKELSKLTKSFNSYITAIEYQGSEKSDITEVVQYFLADYDLIIDLRAVKGKRIVWNLIKGQKRITYQYTHPEFKKLAA